MRIRMDNYYRTQSTTADMENLDTPISLRVRKLKRLLSERHYYKISLTNDTDCVTLILNKEQLEKFSKSLNSYIAEGNYKKRIDSKESDFHGKI